ncbi:MAG: hypothetical protein ABWZ15_10205 [Acidimicrobiia bacterium]
MQRRTAGRCIAEALRWTTPGPDPAVDLHDAERKCWSQHGEDGLLDALIARVGAPTRTFVEVGASDGHENCTRALAEGGWKGFWFEADPERARRARELETRLDVRTHCAIVSANNVVRLMENAGVPNVPDVLSLDIDGNDFWVLRSMLRKYAPRVVVVEYNATFPPGHFWTRRERKRAEWDDTYRHGASLDALAWLCARAGYRLVACDSAGANAFFVRADVADAARLGVEPVHLLYRPLLIAPPRIGHPWWPEPDCPRLTDDEMARVRIVGADIVTRFGGDPENVLVGIRARIDNATPHLITSVGPTPMNLSAHAIAADGSTMNNNMQRNVIFGGVAPHSRRWVGAVYQVERAAAVLRLCLVHEGIGWLMPGAFDITLT